MYLEKLSFKKTLAAFCLLCGMGVGLYYVLLSLEPDIPVTENIELPPKKVATVEELYPYVVKPQSTLFSNLRDLNVSPQTIDQIVKAAESVVDLRKIKPGMRFQIVQEVSAQPQVSQLNFRLSASEVLHIKKVNDSWTAEKVVEQIETKVVTFAGTVVASLWKSAESAQMDINLISDLAEIFGWQIDFSREVRVKDRWRLTVEQKFIRGEPIGWGQILAAEYENAGELHTAVFFKAANGDSGYYGPDGASLRRMFLKSPLKFGRISSRFSRSRFHPILQINRPHLGVDYAAPMGTPIRAVGDGVVTFATWAGGAGKMLKIHHNATYTTAYKHLSGYAKGIHNGSRVKQGDIVAYVGTTGLSTGPHLHFEFYQNGQYIDPLGKKFPSADPVPTGEMSEFKAQFPKLVSLLPSWELAN
jgi:murein DD-endopeptidase MepM/ murein hydrolase activator NlpD